MRFIRTSLKRPLSRRLVPLAYALAAVTVLIVALTWIVLQVQITLAGFLNSESLWSKAQKQAVIDLGSYAARGDAAALARFQHSYDVLESDRWGRDAIATGDYTRGQIEEVFRRGSIMPAAQPGMIFMLEHFSTAPHIRQALEAWRSTDSKIAELKVIADELQRSYAAGSMSASEVARQYDRINALNVFIEPRTQLFAVEVVNGAIWLGQVLFWGVLLAFVLAALLWIRMARRILESIRTSEERYRLLFDSAADAIVMVNEDTGSILDANVTASSWTGRAPEELVGDNFGGLFAQDLLPAGRHAATTVLQGADGQSRPVEMQSSLTTWGSQPVRQAIIRDISERMAMEQERRVAAEALASIAEGVIIADADRRVVTVNAAHTAMTGFTAELLQQRRFDETRRLPNGEPLPPSIWHAIAQGGNWQGEVLSQRRDGTSYPEMLSISAIRDGHEQIQHYVAVFTNITAIKANQRRLEHLATHDPLTGLINRSEFERHCARAITTAAHERGATAVLFIDLDAFKIVNDSYSHAIGDRLLIKAAERIRAELSENDVASRIGGDEFTVLVGRLGSREDAYALANRLLAALAEPVVIGEYEIVLSASIGVAGYPLDGTDAPTLISNADAAMYAAKTEERNTFRFYTPLMHADARKRLHLASQLRRALTRDEFRLAYQPSVELRSGKIVAVETLLRWQHPERGELQPSEFITMAEGFGLIRRIDEWVLRMTCAQIRRWDQAGVPPIRVAVNVSASWFGHPSFVEGLRRTLLASHLSGERLMIEITEGAMLRLGEDTERTLRALHALGVEVAIDDFGTGYSSLSYLKLPAVTCVKIDRSFVIGLPGSANDMAIVEAMLAIARSLDLRVIAEGIETEEQHEFLLRAGCLEGQGFLYSRALPAAEIERLLSTRPQQAPRLKLVPPERP